MSDAPSPWAPDSGSRRAGKSAAAFRTISEVSSELEVPQHVLRFWETKFPQVKPLKRAGGRRYYRPEDVSVLRRIRDLLYRDGFTIKGAQKLLREAPRGGAHAAEVEEEGGPGPVETGGNGGGTAAEASATRSASPAKPAASLLPAKAAGPDRSELAALLRELEDLREWLRRKLA
jgi:DNA-binding transcriptional MerR regulator